MFVFFRSFEYSLEHFPLNQDYQSFDIVKYYNIKPDYWLPTPLVYEYACMFGLRETWVMAS